MDLQQRVVLEQLRVEGRDRPKETAVADLLDRLSNG